MIEFLKAMVGAFKPLPLQAKAAVAMVFLWLLAVSIGVTLALVKQGNETDQIKEARVVSIRTDCAEKNTRHYEVRNGLKIFIAALPKSPKPAPYVERKAGEHLFNLLVIAIAPRYDCPARIKAFTTP